MKFDNHKQISRRAAIIGIMFAGLFIMIGIRVIFLQTVQGPWLSKKAANQYEKSVIIRGKRGIIFDAAHREMAVSIQATSLAAYPGRIKNKNEAARKLSNILKIRFKNLRRKLETGRSFVWLKRQATPRQVQAVKALNLKGIGFIPEFNRFYPNKTLGAQVLGFSGIDGRGLEGLEFYYNAYLKGSERKIRVLTDALGRQFDTGQTNANGLGGNNIILTIDGNIQYITETALEEAAKKYNAESGIAIVMAPATGAILAMAHYPFFNPNAFNSFSRDRWRNRSITDSFEPGSTMKIFSAAAALDSGICDPNTIFYCENGEYRIGRNIIHDTKPHGWLSVQQIIKVSSNIGTVKVAEKVGGRSLYNLFKKFGFGNKTGVDCPGESTGSLSFYNKWSNIDKGTISFGQGVSVSALQLTSAAAAIANDGILMKPYLVQAITDQNGRLIQNFSPQKIHQVISARTARDLKRIMETVMTEGGTGVLAALEGYTVCGKTGTAQKVSTHGGYSKDKYIASFLGFAPAKKPEIVILVILDEPKKEHYGGIVAGPAFKKIAHQTLQYLNFTPLRQKKHQRVLAENEVSG